MRQEELLKLIGKCRAGDTETRGQLVEAVQDRVYFYCLRILKNRDDAQDAAQEALIAMLSGLGSLREPELFWAWLAQITIRACRRQQAQAFREERRRWRAEEALLSSQELQDDQQRPDKRLDSEENRRMIVELVDALPESQRLCVLLYYYGELPVKEIARVLETTEGTVKSRLYYARRAIKKGVEGYAAQGFKLYELSPLPFLQYFLQQEAAVNGLGTASAGVTEAVMAAAGASAIAGGAVAAGTAGKTVLEGLAAKKAVIAAGLLLAGAAAGGVLCRSAREIPAEMPSAQAVQTASPAVPDPVPDLLKPLARRQEPAPVEVPVETEQPAGGPAAQPVGPVAAVLREDPEPMPAPPPEEPEPTLPPEPLPEVRMDWNIVLEHDPTAWLTPEPAPEPVVAPVRTPRASAGQASRPVPVPEEPPEEPGPVVPDPELPAAPTVVKAAWNHRYGYTNQFSNIWDGWLPPGPLRYSSDDPEVAYVFEDGTLITRSPGTATLTAVDPQDPGTEYALMVTVEDAFNWEYGFRVDDRDDDTYDFQVGHTLTQAIDRYVFYIAQYPVFLDHVNWRVSDPSVLAVTPWAYPAVGSCDMRALSPGTVTLTADVTFEVRTPDGPEYFQDSCSCQITVKEPPAAPVQPEEGPGLDVPGPVEPDASPTVISRAFCERYGRVTEFSTAWGSQPPSGSLRYSSDDPEVAYVFADGTLITRSPGTATLTAIDPEDPGTEYALTVTVEDAFNWEFCFSFDDGRDASYDFPVGSTVTQRLENQVFYIEQYGIFLDRVAWRVSDPSVLEITPWKYPAVESCDMHGLSPGTVTLTADITFQVYTPEGCEYLQDSYSCEVTVGEPLNG